MIKHPLRAGVLGAVVAAGSAVALPATTASAADSTPPPAPAAASARFTQDQHRLEQQLAYRTTELQRLTTDVSASTTLTASDKTTLSGRLTTETAAIVALVGKVPTDTTVKELNADRASMLRDNRVYAVVVPQVFEVIEADAVAAESTTLAANEPALQSSVSALSGEPGYALAERRYAAFVALVNRASTGAASVDSSVITQVPQDFPGDTHVFVTASHKLLDAEDAIAHANYTATLIGLAAGGYTGS